MSGVNAPIGNYDDISCLRLAKSKRAHATALQACPFDATQHDPCNLSSYKLLHVVSISVIVPRSMFRFHKYANVSFFPRTFAVYSWNDDSLGCYCWLRQSGKQKPHKLLFELHITDQGPIRYHFFCLLAKPQGLKMQPNVNESPLFAASLILILFLSVKECTLEQ